MKVKDVILKYHKIVPFPWSVKKIQKADCDPMELCRSIGEELAGCEDKDEPKSKHLIDTLKDLGMMS